jgi:CBS domain-containing protein
MKRKSFREPRRGTEVDISPFGKRGGNSMLQAKEIRIATDTALLVRDLMSTDLITLTQEDDLQSLAAIFDTRAIRHVPIVNLDDDLVGLVTHRDRIAHR